MEVIKLIQNRDEIEWTPNVIASEVLIDGSTTDITLTSDTPNLKEYQIKESDSDDWKKTEKKISLDLTATKNELAFRT